MKKNSIIISVIIGLSLLNAFPLFSSSKSDEKAIPAEIEEKILFQAQKFKYILEMIYLNYQAEADIEKISEKSFNALLTALDPYCHYSNPEEYKKIAEDQLGNQDGVGLSLILLSDTLTVLNVVSGSPADKAGIRNGDKILFIDGNRSISMTVPAANALINGTIGTEVSIIAKRGYSSTLEEYNLTRERIHLESLHSYFLVPETKAGYFRLTRFSLESYDEFINAAEKLKKAGMNSIILDLRGNLGGALDIVVKIAEEFLNDGDKITYTVARNPIFVHNYLATKNGKFANMPLVVIIDESSASGSEIIAGVVQDLDRGLVIGNISMGKGLVQRWWNMVDGSAFKLTVAKYYTPSGRLIQKDWESGNVDIDPSLRVSAEKQTVSQIEEMLRKTGGRTQLPAFETSKGRTVLGGGGIFPDHFVREDTTTVLTQVLRSYGIVLEFVFDYLLTNKIEIEKKYSKDFILFTRKFEVTDAILKDLEIYSRGRNIWNDSMFAIDKEYIRNFVKAAIAHSIWGNQGYYAVMFGKDNFCLKAIEVMQEAKKMLFN